MRPNERLGGADELLPALVLRLAPLIGLLRVNLPIRGEHLRQVRERADHSGSHPAERGRPEHRGIGAGGLDRRADRVRLKLEHQRLVGEPAVDPQGFDGCGLADSRDHVRHPPGDPLERGPRDVLPRRSAIDPRDHRPRIGAPPRRPDPR
jgi:hypothetical protein